MRMQSASLYCVLAALAALSGCSSAEKCTRGEEGCVPRTGAARNRLGRVRRRARAEPRRRVRRGRRRDPRRRDRRRRRPGRVHERVARGGLRALLPGVLPERRSAVRAVALPGERLRSRPRPEPGHRERLRGVHQALRKRRQPGHLRAIVCARPRTSAPARSSGSRTRRPACSSRAASRTTRSASCEKTRAAATPAAPWPTTRTASSRATTSARTAARARRARNRPACPRGTDCTDCGPRTCVKAGASCDGHGDCCGFYGGKAFCVDLATTGGTCLATCTETRVCPEGLDCLAVDDNQNYVCAPRMQ